MLNHSSYAEWEVKSLTIRQIELLGWGYNPFNPVPPMELSMFRCLAMRSLTT